MIAQERIQQLEHSGKVLIQEIERLPAEVLYRAPSPREWPVMSTLAHLAEMLPYWAHQAQTIAGEPGHPFGRTLDDADRTGAVEEHGHDSLDVAVNRLRASLAECVSVLTALPAEAWASAGQHHSRGMMTVEQLVDAFLVTHVEEHSAQIQETLKTVV